MKVWRKYLEFFDKSNEELQKMLLSEYTDSMIELIRLVFNHEKVTDESIEENLSVAELKPLMLDAFNWLQRVFFTWVEQIPKNEGAAAET